MRSNVLSLVTVFISLLGLVFFVTMAVRAAAPPTAREFAGNMSTLMCDKLFVCTAENAAVAFGNKGACVAKITEKVCEENDCNKVATSREAVDKCLEIMQLMTCDDIVRGVTPIGCRKSELGF